MTQLRRMMLEELQRRNYSEVTTRNYLRVVTDFASHFGKSPDKLGPDHFRTYQAYLLQERKLASGTVVNHVSALRFFFIKTLRCLKHPGGRPVMSDAPRHKGRAVAP